MRVVFPDPLGPMMMKKFPFRIENEIRFKTGVFRYEKVKSMATIAEFIVWIFSKEI